MTDAETPDTPGTTSQRARATIRTTHEDETTARRVADAVRPDNTDEMNTRVDGAAVETTIERTTASGLQATADDYVVNLRVATGLSDSDTSTGQPDTL